MPESSDSQLLSPLPSSIPCWVLSKPPSVSGMKGKASTLLKKVITVIATMIKAKSMVAKSKRSVIKARFLVFGLLNNKKVLMSAINHKIHSLMGQERKENDEDDEDYSKAIVLHSNAAIEKHLNTSWMKEEEDDDDDDYPDLRHSLFDLEDDNYEDEDELVNGTGSVIDLVRNSREKDSDFCLEDEIDHVADVFIKRFHRQMKIQKQASFKRYREMLARGV